jgi:putative ABC transport system permease protein
MLGDTLLKLSSLDPGFQPRNVLAARFAISPGSLQNPAQIRAAWRDVLDGIRRVPEVQFAALADIIPMREGENSLPYKTTPAPLPPNHEPVALASSVTPDYLKVMGIPLRAGRFFNEHDDYESKPVIVIDENLARHAFGGENAVGRHLWIHAMGPAPVEIVGVCGHVRHWGLAGDDQSRVHDQLYYPFSQAPAPLLRFYSSVMSIAVRTKTDPLSLIKPLQLELRGPAGDQALYEVRTMEQLVSGSVARQRFLLVLFGTFAGMALLLAAIGIYGVLAYLTGQRTPEIGVRMAVGAIARDIVWLVLRQCLRMVLPGLGLGALVALAAGRVFQRFVQGMQPVHAAVFAIMIPLLLAAALLAGFLPARRASRVDPVTALRQA